MGDRNTKFFHDMVKRNAAKSSILAITKSDGSTITSATEIGQEFVTYFTSHLGTEVQTLPVGNDVFNWGPKLSFALAFGALQGSHSVGGCTTVLDFFKSGGLLRQLNHNIIALVLKLEHCSTVGNYRSISCCNVIYKAITKIITNRLAPAMEHLTDRCQAAFVGGRSITNIFLAHEMVRKTSDSNFNFHPKCDKLKITHLLFADDLMLFSRGDLPSIHILMEWLQEFKNVSSLTVNTSKSSIFTAGIENNQLYKILGMTDFARGEMPVRVWSVFGSKSFHSQWRSLRKSTGFGIFFETPEEHQLLGRIFVIPRMKAALVSGIFNLGTWPSLPGYYGTSTAKQTRCRCSGSTVFISEEDQFGIGNRRRAIHHSSSGLPKSATELLTHLAG
ncbi:UNVERIFIED_CONTAM: hypothetical protein Scaly_2677900 [Sesamum calycinum]|uniref:Reverse transcriptase domain-containing protein n=1 Tax=Sesamum calycinum TaxID=2727403 RepID=A0AAW2J6Q4_9LAMI